MNEILDELLQTVMDTYMQDLQECTEGSAKNYHEAQEEYYQAIEYYKTNVDLV